MATAEERFWAKVQRGDDDACWMWTAARNKDGYGVLAVGGRGEGNVLAHRYSYVLAHGLIPDGLVLDHLCRDPACVNPAHLEAVTNRENILRGMSREVLIHRSGVCGRGHERTPENTYWMRDGRPQCRACKRERERRYYREGRPYRTKGRAHSPGAAEEDTRAA
jgi:hypothetical protein